MQKNKSFLQENQTIPRPNFAFQHYTYPELCYLKRVPISFNKKYCVGQRIQFYLKFLGIASLGRPRQLTKFVRGSRDKIMRVQFTAETAAK